MRKPVALILVVVLLSGCATNRKSTLSTSPSPPRSAETIVVGVVLPGGAEVRFLEPAVLAADGTVHGSIAVESETAPEGALVSRAVAYEPGEIAGYLVTDRTEKDGSASAFGALLAGAGLIAGLIAVLLVVGCATDGDDGGWGDGEC